MKPLFVGVVAPVLTSATISHAQTTSGRQYGRSVVVSTEGIVATSQVIASQVGTQMLARGGSVVDAAIAANLVLSVVEPMMCGIGGDLFAIYRDARTGQLSGLNASGWSPAGLTIEKVKATGAKSMSDAGIHRFTVPGAADGWAQLHARFGKLPWRELFQPAIRLAKDGFPVSERTAVDWKDALVPSCVTDDCKRVFLPAGKPLEFGEIFRNPGMANALDLLSRRGPREVYQGAIAKA